MENKNTKNFYLGIDLGTTNTVLAWGRVDTSGRITPMVADVRSMSEGQGIVKQALLPSCVYYKKGSPGPIVGGYARKMQSRQSKRVVRSVKSLMGSGQQYDIDEQKITPAQVSAAILKHVALASKDLFAFVPDDVVITVPASFDSDQRSDTLEAAREAGFRVTNDDGSPRNILLDEPRAALYDFINRQERGEIPETLIDFSSPKNVLVFDLGGGTLDVSLHTVKNTTSGDAIDVMDLAISRYTRLGGDDFDTLLQEFLMSRFAGKLDINCLDEMNAELVRNNFLEEAEKAKIGLCAMVENCKLQGREDISGLVHEILRPNIYENRLFEYDLSIEEYRTVIEPLLAPDLTMESLNKFDELNDRSYNIIYPILDVLNKSRMRQENVPHVDAVLLNGGMTKLFAVQERLAEFFGFAPLAVGDPDKSVARGAVVHHYALHRGIRPTRIQNENVGIALEGGKLLNIIQAGIVLPYNTGVIDVATTAADAMMLDLPFYVGARPDIQEPNRRIARRRVRFNQPLPADTPIQLRAVVDEAGIINLSGWRTEAPDDRFTVSVITSHTEADQPIPRPIAPGFRKKPVVLPVPSGNSANIPALLERFKSSGNKWAKSHAPNIKARFMKEIRAAEDAMAGASNCGEAVPDLVAVLNENTALSERAAFLLGRILPNCLEEGQQGIRALEKTCRISSLVETARRVQSGLLPESARQNLLTVRAAAEALSKLGRSKDEKLFLDMANSMGILPDYFAETIFHALGRTGGSEAAMKEALAASGSRRAGSRIAAWWALGHIGSREKDKPVPVACIEKILPTMLKRLQNERHGDAARNGVYALGEVCDQRGNGERVRAALLPAVEALLQRMETRTFTVSGSSVPNFTRIANAMIHGAELSEEQKENLLKLRREDA